MKTIQQLANQVLTEIKALPTKEAMPTTPRNQSARLSLSDFKTLSDRYLHAARLEAEAFCSDIFRDPWGRGYCLSLLGPSGVGKTFLVNCILGHLGIDAWGNIAVPTAIIGDRVARGHVVKRDWRKVSGEFKQGDYSIVEVLESEFMVALDDIGADHDPSRNAVANLDRILRSRTGKWTLITSNLLPNQIKTEMDQRIASWMYRDRNKVVEIKTTDWALR